MARHRVDRFGRKGAYRCHACHTLTRETGHDEAELDLCKRCLFEAYVENAASDYGEDSPEYRTARGDAMPLSHVHAGRAVTP